MGKNTSFHSMLEGSHFHPHFQKASYGMTLPPLGFRGQPILARTYLCSLGLQSLAFLLQAPLNELFCLPAGIMAWGHLEDPVPWKQESRAGYNCGLTECARKAWRDIPHIGQIKFISFNETHSSCVPISPSHLG